MTDLEKLEAVLREMSDLDCVIVTADMCPHEFGSSMLCEICTLKSRVECKARIILDLKIRIEKLEWVRAAAKKYFINSSHTNWVELNSAFDDCEET